MLLLPARRLGLALAASLVTLAAASRADAQQFTIEPDISCSDDLGVTYFGPYLVDGNECGVVNDGGQDAFDDFGNPVGYRRLQLTRRVEAFPERNLFRFVDTYTNTGTTTIRALIGLSGELGSDSDSRVRLYDNDFIVTADADPADPDVPVGSDPVLAFVFGNNALSRTFFSADLLLEEDEIFMGGPVTFAPGEMRSVLFYAFLAYDVQRDTPEEQAADEALAIARARELVAQPFVDGLSAEERARIVNFDVSVSDAAVVPEPGTWALLGTGLVALAGVARRRRSR